ncbi:hypothetical protein N7532_011011 [Penicillium argentinense]|uniref:YCII-related domain-containing protein n=1 Tax=Penicillium argentinense TaxID=1131581 RepID=A0A9W9EHL2_9EURO|nr:uncharacterized protein N7532_011011 [Penicillium argentinense]KAJ5081968.1 hypothetical protein N7532_011011 [Penicillium argentinense]
MPPTLTRALSSLAPAFPHARQPFLRTTSKLPSHPPRPLSLNNPLHSLRTMSTAPKKEFLCILPDKPGALAKRLEVRPSHLEGVKPLVASGRHARRPPRRRRNPSFKGSMMLAQAENEAEVRKILENDIYTRSGVWDLENAQIIPFKSAVREQL